MLLISSSQVHKMSKFVLSVNATMVFKQLKRTAPTHSLIQPWYTEQLSKQATGYNCCKYSVAYF